MGEALLRLERYEEALAALARALALQPEPSLSGVLHRLMGRAALESGRDQAAAEHLEGALQLDPRDAAALDYLALVRFRQQRYAAALELYRRLVELTPDSAQTHANIGAALYYLDRVDEAVRSFEHALSLEPTLETARTALDGIRKSLPREAP